MTNIIYLIGRLATESTTNEDNESKKILVKVSVTRSYKNKDGVYECDIFPVNYHFPIMM